jgi:hypothetical protein
MNSDHQTSAHGSVDEPIHKDVTFESRDINAFTIFKYIVALGVAVGLAFAVTILIFRFTTRMAVDSETPMAPVHQGVGTTMPPEPRLQGVPGHETDPQRDLREKRAEDEKANEQLGWVNRPAGIAQIPVEEAMKIIVSKGLPSVPPPAAEKKK